MNEIAERTILAAGLVLVLLAGLAILCELRALREDVAELRALVVEVRP